MERAISAGRIPSPTAEHGSISARPNGATFFLGDFRGPQFYVESHSSRTIRRKPFVAIESSRMKSVRRERLAFFAAYPYGLAMTLKEAGAKLGLSPVTLQIQIGNKKLRAVKRGRDWWVTPREVERYRLESLGQAKGGAPRGKRAPRA